jgi:hypothetical protein
MVRKICRKGRKTFLSATLVGQFQKRWRHALLYAAQQVLVAKMPAVIANIKQRICKKVLITVDSVKFVA